VTVPVIHRYAVWVNATVARILSLLSLLFMRLSTTMERAQATLGHKTEDYGLSGRVADGKFPIRSDPIGPIGTQDGVLAPLTMVDPWPARLRFQLVGL